MLEVNDLRKTYLSNVTSGSSPVTTDAGFAVRGKGES